MPRAKLFSRSQSLPTHHLPAFASVHIFTNRPISTQGEQPEITPRNRRPRSGVGLIDRLARRTKLHGPPFGYVRCQKLSGRLLGHSRPSGFVGLLGEAALLIALTYVAKRGRVQRRGLLVVRSPVLVTG